MLTVEQENIIEKYVDEKYYDKERLKKYLDIHDIVGNEVFQYCDKDYYGNGETAYSSLLNYKYGYTPLPVNIFVNRIPFYFYTVDKHSLKVGYMGSLGDLFHSGLDTYEENVYLEKIYQALEYMFYELNLPLERIFNYWINQTGKVSGDLFFKWEHYLKLCQNNNINNPFPDRFITAYNQLLEKSGLQPLIYEISEIGIGELYYRFGNTIEFAGVFPCNDDGKPIMKWIGIRAKNANKIRCWCEKSKEGRLQVEITPDTIVHILDPYRLGENDWRQIYAGPKTMYFDHTALKKYRKSMKFTQQEVADAIETDVRTYQKWESGQNTPDGYFLLRLLNWLDISDIQEIITYKEV